MAVAAAAVVVRPVAPVQASLWSDAWRRLRRNRLALAGAIYLTGLLVVALVAFVWTPYPMAGVAVAQPYSGPSPAHWFGADLLGRDVLSRVMVGAQISLTVGIGTQLIVLAVGVPVGLIAGYFGGWLDSIVSFLVNVFYGVPDLLVALLLVVLLGHPGLDKIIIAISVTRWMDMTRLVRGQTLALREREFIEAARASGAKPIKILFGHILPNALGPVIVAGTINVADAIIAESTLSFLGLGFPSDIPTWGRLLYDAKDYLDFAPHWALIAGAAIFLAVLAINFIGDGLRDVLDPRRVM
jgi:peptide/nickel transport system permease protein